MTDASFAKLFNIDDYQYLATLTKYQKTYILRIIIGKNADAILYERVYFSKNKNEIANAYNEINDSFVENHFNNIQINQ